MTDRLVIIPAHNEEKSIREVVTRALKYADVSVTDDGSRDGTPAILKEIQNECMGGMYRHKIYVITHQQTTHIPRGLQDGLRFGIQHGYRTFVTMDAGLSHDPEVIPRFFRPLSLDGYRYRQQNVHGECSIIQEGYNLDGRAGHKLYPFGFVSRFIRPWHKGLY